MTGRRSDRKIAKTDTVSSSGDCSYIEMDYKETLKLKQELVKRSIGKSCSRIEPVVGADDPYHYRNKVYAAFGRDRSGIICGQYEPGSHRIVPDKNNPLENKTASQIIETIRVLAGKFKVSIYDERTRSGLLRGVLVRTADGTGEVMVVIVIAEPVFPGKKEFVKRLVSEHPVIKTVVFNINRRTDSMILGDKTETAYGPGAITDELCGMRFMISPESFYQINHDQAEKLYDLAIGYADLKPGDKVLDAYCGTGTIGMVASKTGCKVTGVELNRRATEDAKINKKINNVSNISFINDDATRYIEQSAVRGNKYDVIILDPPRSGTTPEFIRACGKLAPQRIVYVSCDPKTLGRDLGLFEKEGYKAVTATPVDMFCFTEHVEVVSLLQRVSITRIRNDHS